MQKIDETSLDFKLVLKGKVMTTEGISQITITEP